MLPSCPSFPSSHLPRIGWDRVECEPVPGLGALFCDTAPWAEPGSAPPDLPQGPQQPAQPGTQVPRGQNEVGEARAVLNGLMTHRPRSEPISGVRARSVENSAGIGGRDHPSATKIGTARVFSCPGVVEFPRRNSAEEALCRTAACCTVRRRRRNRAKEQRGGWYEIHGH